MIVDLDRAIGDALVEDLGSRLQRELEFYRAREEAHAHGSHADEIRKCREDAEAEWKTVQRWRLTRADHQEAS